MKNDFESRIRRIYRCPVCGLVRIFGKAGLSCPGGCGKIVHVERDLRRSLARRMPVRYADRIRGSRRMCADNR